MKSIFLVLHLHTLPQGDEDIKAIGVYASLDDAMAAVARLRQQPGFCEFPALLDPLSDDSTDGFTIDEYRIGQDQWSEGFVTSSPNH